MNNEYEFKLREANAKLDVLGDALKTAIACLREEKRSGTAALLEVILKQCITRAHNPE